MLPQKNLRRNSADAESAEVPGGVLAIPAIKDRRPRRRNSQSDATYTVEALMHDGKALQSVPVITSVTVSPRLSASVRRQGQYFKICTSDLTKCHDHPSDQCIDHEYGDNEDLIHSRVAPIQICIVPVMQKKETHSRQRRIG